MSAPVGDARVCVYRRERASGSPQVAPVPLGTVFLPPKAGRIRTPIPWNLLQLAYCFAVVPAAARAAVEVESSSFWASFESCHRPLVRCTQDSEEHATPLAWTRHAFQTPSARLPSVPSADFVQTTAIPPIQEKIRWTTRICAAIGSNRALPPPSRTETYRYPNGAPDITLSEPL